MAEIEMNSSGSEEEYDSDDELREALAQGLLKPGLNVEVQPIKQRVNNVPKLKRKLEEITLDLPWLERLDMVNGLAELAPELAVQIERHEQKRSKMFAGNAKLPYVEPEKDPVLNDFKREMLFYRQAQSAVAEGIKKLHDLGVKTKRPDDYFAEMAKTDEHMQKVRSNLMAKQEGQAKSERVRHLREQRKMGKIIEKQSRVKKAMDKKDTLDQLKKFRKGKLKNLDFLEDEKQQSGKKGKPGSGKKNTSAKRQVRDSKFGFGGKKKGSKRNTKTSSMDSSSYKKSNSKKSVGGSGGGGGFGGAAKRPGKGRRVQAKARRK